MMIDRECDDVVDNIQKKINVEILWGEKLLTSFVPTPFDRPLRAQTTLSMG